MLNVRPPRIADRSKENTPGRNKKKIKNNFENSSREIQKSDERQTHQLSTHANSEQVIPGLVIASGNSAAFSNKMILTTNSRKDRNKGSQKWKSTGPSDKNLEELYSALQVHFKPSLLKKMYSVDIETVSEALNHLKETLEGETEVFMDVQDLVLKWIFERTFSGRPDIVVNLNEF